jgi:hypothetical protein
MVYAPGTQQIEEVRPALARLGREPGEVVIADRRAEAVLARMTLAGIGDRDPGCRLQACPQHVTFSAVNLSIGFEYWRRELLSGVANPSLAPQATPLAVGFRGPMRISIDAAANMQIAPATKNAGR